jgi:hypothetical protein
MMRLNRAGHQEVVLASGGEPEVTKAAASGTRLRGKQTLESPVVRPVRPFEGGKVVASFTVPL